jgi:hypothetical protein
MEIDTTQLVKVWDREGSGMITGIRAIYKSKKEGECATCMLMTTRVIDYLGKLEFCCVWCGGGE